MKRPVAGPAHSRRVLVAALAMVAATPAWSDGTTGNPVSSRHDGVTLAQNTTPERAAQPILPAPTSSAATALTWTFDAARTDAGAPWTAERGTLTLGAGEARLQPDPNRRVALLSPSGLPDATREAEEFVIGLSGTGLERVRIQARRDARGGWITIADADGNALRETADGFVIKRGAAARGAPIERLRIELTFRTTNVRPLTRISIRTAAR